MSLEKIGIKVPEVLLPNKKVDLTKWAVVACDQYTSEPEYWEDVAKLTKDHPSTLHIMLPELYLESPKKDEMIRSINQNMEKYLSDGTLVLQKRGFVLIDRKTEHAPSRKGLITLLDLEKYDFSKGSQTLIRATEGTILDRIPPRVQIRQSSPIELPHIMVLIDDPKHEIIEPLFSKEWPLLYDTNLMKGGGHIKGWLVDDEESQNKIGELLLKQAAEKGPNPLIFAMGDGNHSLATAKTIWENMKKSATDKLAIMDHPARFALVELVNLHDKGITFEAIHRVLFNLEERDFIDHLTNFYKNEGSTLKVFHFKSQTEMNKMQVVSSSHAIRFCNEEGFGVIVIENPKRNLDVATIQSAIDPYLKVNTTVKIDYIHGDEVVTSLGRKRGNMGLYLNPIRKDNFFKTIIKDGALPRKTFSMGEAAEKRFYFESRKIR